MKTLSREIKHVVLIFIKEPSTMFSLKLDKYCNIERERSCLIASVRFVKKLI